MQARLLEAAKAALEAGRPARTVQVAEEDARTWRLLQLLTGEAGALRLQRRGGGGGDGERAVGGGGEAGARPRAPGCVVISAAIEEEIAQLDDAERAEYLEPMGLHEAGLDRLIREGYRLLGLSTYFTAGPKEARAWTIPAGASAPQAAGVIHGDFEKRLHPGGDDRPTTSTWRSAARRARARPGGCAPRARPTGCRTATCCISSSAREAGWARTGFGDGGGEPEARLDGDADDGAAEEGAAQRLDARTRSRSRAGGRAVVGRAFTLRFVPAREDLATPASWASPISTRAAIEAMPAGCVAVVDAAGVADAGIFGDILCARMAQRGVAALVTDGAVRDLEGVLGTGLPVWCRGAAAPPSVAGLTFVGWQEPVGCGGVAVFPDDVIVADRDGAVVVPQALLGEVRRRGGGAGADGGLDHGRGRARREPARALSDERRDARPLRGRARAGLRRRQPA